MLLMHHLLQILALHQNICKCQLYLSTAKSEFRHRIVNFFDLMREKIINGHYRCFKISCIICVFFNFHWENQMHIVKVHILFVNLTLNSATLCRL